MDWVPVRCRIPDLCRERKITASQCANTTGISESAISDYSHMRKMMMLETAKKFGEFFSVPIDDLYEWEQKETRRKIRKAKTE